MKSINKFVASVIFPIALIMGGNVQASDKVYPDENKTIEELFDLVIEEQPAKVQKLPFSEKDKHCLAKNIYYESRGESVRGKRAVAQVTLNRTKSPKFSNTICGVVYQPGQFSWARGSSEWSSPKGTQWAEAQQLAEDILINGKALEGMDNALYFHSTKANPNWKNLRRLVTIGGHVFYGRG